MHARTQDFLKRFGSLYGLEHDGVELNFSRALSDDHDSMHFKQSYMGIPVHGASLLIGLKGEEVVFTIGNLLLPYRQLNTVPRITAAKAVEIARKVLAKPRLPLAADPALMFFDIGLLTQTANDPALAWRVTLGRRNPYRLFIDAGRGTVLFKQSLLEDNGSSLHGFDLDVEDAEEEASAQWDGCFTLSSDTEVATESWFNSDYLDDPDAVMAKNAAREAYRYFHTQFNWHSYNNESSEINVFIHADTDGGAQWVPTCDLIQIQTGRPSMDTLAHELTHGIIRRGSDLDYEFQPGALNEHYADAMALAPTGPMPSIAPVAPARCAISPIPPPRDSRTTCPVSVTFTTPTKASTPTTAACTSTAASPTRRFSSWLKAEPTAATWRRAGSA